MITHLRLFLTPIKFFVKSSHQAMAYFWDAFNTVTTSQLNPYPDGWWKQPLKALFGEIHNTQEFNHSILKCISSHQQTCKSGVTNSLAVSNTIPDFFFKHSGPKFHIMSPYCGDSMQTVLYKNFPSFLQVKIQYFTFILGKVMAVSLIRKNKSLKTNLQYEPTWTKLFCFLNTTVTVLHMFILHLRCLERNLTLH